MEEKISIIVPVFNTEMFLRRCIDSIISQTYENLEIILVDDGSTDSSPEICDEYERKDSRIKVIHQKNGGLSKARNAALEKCTGDYIGFVDSDDYIQKNMYELLVDCMHKHDVDIAVCQWQWQTVSGEWTVPKDSIPRDIYGEHGSTEFAEFLYRGSYANGVACAVWNKLYKKKLFENLRFKGFKFEDENVNDIILSKNIKLYVLSEILYVYCENKNSLTHKPFSADDYVIFEILRNRILYFSDKDFIVNKTKLLYCNLYISYFFCAKEAGIQPYSDKKTYKNYRNEVKTDRKTKMRFLLFDLSPNLYRTMLKWKNKTRTCL